ncbi:uncharacterized protein [Oscarella lobularis]|uniref:uncharacterized protein n=1 Tax=Oscarella lobularis TaxID=121494 RepID=UPI003313CB73
MVRVTISLNSTATGVYRPGETISGTVNVNLEKPLEATKLVAMLHGEVNVKSESKTYLDCEEDVWNKTGTQSNTQATLAAGGHTFPFSFHLPAQLPSTIEGEKMFIRYRIKAKMFRKKGENYSDTKDFPVCSFLVMKPDLFESVSKEDQIMIGGRNRSGPVILRVTLAKTAYEPGESIMIGPTVENNSKKSFTVLIANLCQHRVVLGGTVQKSSKAVAALVFDDGAVNAGETRVWSHEKVLYIPPDLPPTTHCELFNLDYSVDLILKGCDLVVSVPIVLGWKPPSSSVSEPKSGATKSSVGDCKPKDETKLSESKQSNQDDGPKQQPKPHTHEDAPVASRHVSQERQPQPQPRRTSQDQSSNPQAQQPQPQPRRTSQDRSSNIYPHSQYPSPPHAQHPPPPHAQHPPPPRAQRSPSSSEHPPYQYPQHPQDHQYSPPYHPPSEHPPPHYAQHPPPPHHAQHPPPPHAHHAQHPPPPHAHPTEHSHPHAQHPPPPRAQRPPSSSEHLPYQYPQHPQDHQYSPPYHPPSEHPPPHHAQHPPPPHHAHHAQHPPPPHAHPTEHSHPHAQHPPPPRAQRPPSSSEHLPYQYPQHPQDHQYSPPYHPPSEHPPPHHAQHPPPPHHAQHPPPPHHAQHPPPPHHAQHPPPPHAQHYYGRHSADFPNERHSYNPDYQQPSAPTAPPVNQDWDYRRH